MKLGRVGRFELPFRASGARALSVELHAQTPGEPPRRFGTNRTSHPDPDSARHLLRCRGPHPRMGNRSANLEDPPGNDPGSGLVRTEPLYPFKLRVQNLDSPTRLERASSITVYWVETSTDTGRLVGPVSNDLTTFSLKGSYSAN